MDVRDLVSKAIDEAAAAPEAVAEELVEGALAEGEVSEEEATEAATETIMEFTERMMEAEPLEVMGPTERWGELTLLPGFTEFNLGLGQIYGMKWGALKYYLEWKTKAYQPHLVPTPSGLHVVRGFSRREWGSLQKKILEHVKDRVEKHSEEASDKNWAETEIQMHTEEMIVVAGCADPQYTTETVRSLPTGVVSHLANCVMAASGHDQNPLPPMPLK